MPKRSKGGPRTAILSVRVPEKLKFGLELIARLNGESVPDVMVRAANMELSSENGGLFAHVPGEELPVFMLPRVWDEREGVRLAKLALTFPNLRLKKLEALQWALIRNNDKYWKSSDAEGRAVSRRVSDLKEDVLAADWDDLAAKADAQVVGEAPVKDT